MLKKLELVGFKSFADKTAFEFAPGITAVVGPNGSGKSNVVDAVRWLLGEQSARSLRGGEMTDVIFNGSSSRKSLGMAEVTMVFDNRTKRSVVAGPPSADDQGPRTKDQGPRTNDQGPMTNDHRPVLNIAAEEVRITRRVYRDGVGEYLINGQLCRLKDIKDLFLGSGAGTSAYCIIEQGRVDALLQASTDDRRLIFEEAAGISRFKARKVETLRRLERVEQNLQRLRDIIAEVDKQLRKVRHEAGKAQKWQEYTRRLQEVRVGLGLREWHDLSGRLAAELTALEALRARLGEIDGQSKAWDDDARRLDETLGRIEAALRERQAEQGEADRQAADAEKAFTVASTQATDLERGIAEAQRRQAELTARADELAASLEAARKELTAAAEDSARRKQHLVSLQADQKARTERLDSVRKQMREDRDEDGDLASRLAKARNDRIEVREELRGKQGERERAERDHSQALDSLGGVDAELDGLQSAESELQGQLEEARGRVVDQTRRRDDARRRADELSRQHAELRERHVRLTSRVEALDALEQRFEGFGTGVREVCDILADRRSDAPAPVSVPSSADSFALRASKSALADAVVGLVADILIVPSEAAALVDLALGDAAQRFVVRDPDRLDAALAGRAPFAGRVGFLPLARPANPESLALSPELYGNLAGWSAERADRLVRCAAPELAHLPAQLLGRTLIVDDLSAARRGAALLRATGEDDFRFVTRRGELLAADGTLTVGTHHADTGILSRKSELRELRQQVTVLEGQLAFTERELHECREQVAALEQPLRHLEQAVADLLEQTRDLRRRVEEYERKRSDLQERADDSQRSLENIDRDIAELRQRLATAEASVRQGEESLDALRRRIEANERLVRSLEAEREAAATAVTEATGVASTAAERHRASQERHAREEAGWKQRSEEAARAAEQRAEAEQRLADCRETAAAASSRLADARRRGEKARAEAAELARGRESERARRRQIGDAVETARREREALREQSHAHDLRAADLRGKQEAAARRLRDMYQLDLAGAYAALPAAEDGSPVLPVVADKQGRELSADEATRETDRLQAELTRLGTVNLDSLAELAEVEQRANTLHAQHDDLAAAQKTLNEIINRINTDSRRMFAETFAAVRAEFRELFRKLFGGGMADVTLEDESDVLESGIEINARPPGKELRSISLMSGGEKTLTAVALLLAIFKSRPSPFCLLDEVDAALDEANTARLAGVLREFTGLSQFIVITHSKRTMSAADVLYGVTMQESGVSRQVGVKFEDWPDDERRPENAA